MSKSNHPAKFAFYYMLSLVSLIFLSISTGMIIFQVINKFIPDVLESYRNQFSEDALKFALSALIISAPVFYVTMRAIYKSLFAGDLDKDSAIRKWLTYFILLVSSVVTLGWLIGTLNSFLGGDLTLKFALKALTAIVIAATAFSFYLYDIKRDKVKKEKDKIIAIYLYVSLVVVAAVFVAAIFTVESPRETRNRKLDEQVLNNFDEIDNAINTYYREFEKMPENLEILLAETNFLNKSAFMNNATRENFKYTVTEDRKYELCTTFFSSNKDASGARYEYMQKRWPHGPGEQCLSQKVIIDKNDLERPVPAR